MKLLLLVNFSSFNLMKNSWQSTAKAMIDGKDRESKQAWWKHLIYHILHKSNFYFKPSKIDIGLTHLLRFQKWQLLLCIDIHTHSVNFTVMHINPMGMVGFIYLHILHFVRWEILLFLITQVFLLGYQDYKHCFKIIAIFLLSLYLFVSDSCFIFAITAKM